MDTEFQKVHPHALHTLVTEILQALDVPKEDARTTADVLLAADLRGIDSHGVANLWRYVKGLREGWINPRPTYRVLAETPALLRLDADAGLGQPAGVYAMRRAMEKAASLGAGVAVVCNSNHYGIAGYYAMMALERQMIGVALTNAGVLVVPTFGRQAMLGTNPIAVAAPAGEERPFVLDMATSVVPQGKIATYDRLGKPIPLGWALDERGRPTTDTHQVLMNLAERAGGGLLPLGGEGELFGGHKGYGLALMVDILSAVLSGAAYADTIYPKGPDGKPLPANTGHFMMALDVRLFRPLEEFQAAMDDLIRRLKRSEKAEGQTRIYIHGEKEWEMEEVRRREGIPLHRRVVEDLRAMARSLGVPVPF
ncbi:MAG: Ldh family oxidoreductase [Anaerolineae bacterium]